MTFDHQEEPAAAVTARSAGATRTHYPAPRDFMALQRSAGNAAVARLAARRRSAPQSTGPAAHGQIMQRKFDDLEVGRMTAQIAGDAMTLIAGYNATAPWAQLAGDELKRQVVADKQTLLAIKGKLEALSLAGDDVGVVRQVQRTVGLHLKEVTAQERRFEAEAFAAKPLKEKYLVGLDDENIKAYKTLVGDTLTDTADVSDQALSSIIALYSSAVGGKVAWTKEATLRARQAKGLGGNTGWVTELLGPHRDKAPARDVLRLIGEATTPDTLSIETMIEIINTLHSSGLPGSTEIEEYLGRQINKRTRTESAATVEQKTRQTKEKAAQLRSAALAKLGAGKTWSELEGAIATWRKALKKQAESDTFFTMYKAGRMTVRAIAPTTAQQGGEFEASIPYGETSSTTGKAKMTLERGRQSILTRIEPATWTAGASELAVKQRTGLYELAASLLDPDREGGIYPQLKFYSAPEAVVFTPAASPEDQAIFAAISELADADQPTVREIGSEMTRIILAQSSDMGTKYVDKSEGNQGTDIHYGEVGTIWRYAGQRVAEPTRPYELEARRTNALQYTIALMRDPKKIVNEVVVEYRKHAAGKFPVFTRIDHTRKRFYILDPAKNFAETDEYIDNDGTVKKD